MTAVLSHARVRSTLDVAAATGRPLRWVQVLLEEDERRGLVERVGDGWRLTPEGERLHGRHLRGLEL